jgi:hypothetical protein
VLLVQSGVEVVVDNGGGGGWWMLANSMLFDSLSSYLLTLLRDSLAFVTEIFFSFF